MDSGKTINILNNWLLQFWHMGMHKINVTC